MTNKKRRHKLAKEIRKASGLKLPEAGMVARKIVKGEYYFDNEKFPFISYEGEWYCEECKENHHKDIFVNGPKGRYTIIGDVSNETF